jgi:hypothetical protein
MQRAPLRLLLTRSERWIIYATMGFLWLSGCLWLYLEQRSAQQDLFSNERNAWAPPVLTAHGVVAVVSMYLLGWITRHHILRWWSRHRRRQSGGSLAAILAILVVSGFALFFLTDDRWQRYTSLVHDVFGVAAPILAIQHWFFLKRATRT